MLELLQEQPGGAQHGGVHRREEGRPGGEEKLRRKVDEHPPVQQLVVPDVGADKRRRTPLAEAGIEIIVGRKSGIRLQHDQLEQAQQQTAETDAEKEKSAE